MDEFENYETELEMQVTRMRIIVFLFSLNIQVGKTFPDPIPFGAMGSVNRNLGSDATKRWD